MKPTGLFWWIDRWRKSSAYMDMTLAEQGAYRNLLDEAHLRGGPLPNDERILAKACGDALAWPTVRDVVMARFTLSADGWRNETMDEVYARTMALSAERSEAGRIGGLRSAEARRQAKVQANIASKTSSNGNSPSPSPSPSPDTVSVSTKKDPNASEQTRGGSASFKSGVNGHTLTEIIEPAHRIHAKVLAAKIASDTKVRRRAARIR